MIDRKAKLSLTRQARVLGIGRGSIDYQPQPVTDADLKLMHRIDQLHMEFPSAGSRMLKGLLVQEGFVAGRRTWEYLKICVSDLAHAVFRYGQASKRLANIMIMAS